MQNSDKLTELVEQASLSINMVSPADLSEVENLQAILDQIKQTVGEMGDGPVELLEQAKGTSADAAVHLEGILRKEVEDTNKSIAVVSAAVLALQDLVGQISGAGAETDSESLDTASANEADEQVDASSALTVVEEDIPLVLDFVAEAGEHIESAEAALLELENKPDDEETVNQIFRAFHTIKGMAGFLNLAGVGSLAHSAENLLDLARKGKLVLAGSNTDLAFESLDMLKRMITGLRESVEAGKPVPKQKQLATLIEKLKASVEDQGQAGAIRTPLVQKQDKEPDRMAAGVGEPKVEYAGGRARIQPSDEKIKVSTARLDKLINMAGELVIAQLMVAEEVTTDLAADHELSRKVVHQGKIIRELQELSMSMRMVPIQGVFQKMARLVRDLSHKAGKNIAFSTFGEETELDRSIVDKIADPLVHMVRNSVDHGIEPPQARQKAGKNPAGIVELRAFHQAGNVVIEIKDDGKGLDKERILKKAVDNGIVEQGQELSDEEIFKLIFHAGLSTAQKVTSVSGRGVGMDVVRKNIESLHGKIDISSVLGKGTTFTIRLPLTLAIIDGQVVMVGSERHIIPINSIIKTLRPTPGQLSTVHTRGEMVNVRGELLPLIRLYGLLGAVPNTEDPTEALLVIVEEDGQKACLLVDELLDQQQVVIKSLGEGLGKVKGLSGGAIMGDGRVSLILDVPGLMELAQDQLFK
ncbi:MAG: chemotaxis protein CheA [Planctomycetota bacterium]|jgi:two-component system chemotaxis sensor kinase CheA